MSGRVRPHLEAREGSLGLLRGSVLPHGLHVCSLPVVQYDWKSGSVGPPTLLCFFQTVFTIQYPLPFCMDFRSACQFLQKQKLTFVGSVLNLHIPLGNMAILILSHPEHEHGMSFHVFRLFSVSFNDIGQFSAYKPCTSF